MVLFWAISAIFPSCSSEEDSEIPQYKLYGEWNVYETIEYDLEGNQTSIDTHDEGTYLINIDPQEINYTFSNTGVIFEEGYSYTYDNGVLQNSFFGEIKVVTVTATELHLKEIPQENSSVYTEIFATKIGE